MRVNAVQLAAGLTDEHQIALINSIANPVASSPKERQALLDGIDLLRSSRVEIDGQKLSFVEFFDRFVDSVYADQFITFALGSKQIVTEGWRLKKKIIETIRARFIREKWFRRDLPETRFLIAYCLYWWNALAVGYLFEIEVLQDLQTSGILFQAHDLRLRSERYSSSDLTIKEWRGDIKSSTYFFHAARTSSLSHDFYITRYYDQRSWQYHWFVILRQNHWNAIDGVTQAMTFPNWPADFTTPVAFSFRGTSWTAASYYIWKEKMFIHQQKREDQS